MKQGNNVRNVLTRLIVALLEKSPQGVIKFCVCVCVVCVADVECRTSFRIKSGCKVD